MMLLHFALVMTFRARSGSVDDAGVRSTAAGHRARSTVLLLSVCLLGHYERARR